MEGIINDFSIWLIVKIFAIIAFVLYLLFSIIVVKQVSLMVETLTVPFEKPIKLIALAHLLLAAFVLILAIVVL